jgi:hypothetical protein
MDENTINPIPPPEDVPNPNWSVKFKGDADDASFGKSDGIIKLHIYATDGEYQDAPIVAGNAPFTVHLKIDGNLVRTITGIPACADPAYMNQIPENGPICEYNGIIDQLPGGRYDIVIEDSLLPVPNDCRGFWTINQISPPYATLNGTVDPNGLDTTVWFDFGLTENYDNFAEFGIVNGYDVVNCSMRLKSKTEGSTDPTEYLEAGTTYHYRIRATNSLGTSYGSDMIFTTPTYTAPPEAITLPATDIA